MAFNFATVCMKDDPTTTPEDVVNLKMHMDKQRLIMHEGMQISRFVVFSDYDEQEFVDASVWSDDQTIIHLHDSWKSNPYQRELTLVLQ